MSCTTLKSAKSTSTLITCGTASRGNGCQFVKLIVRLLVSRPVASSASNSSGIRIPNIVTRLARRGIPFGWVGLTLGPLRERDPWLLRRQFLEGHVFRRAYRKISCKCVTCKKSSCKQVGTRGLQETACEATRGPVLSGDPT